ncbi:MAG: hypothetical protein JXO49_11780 [Deltaproteobacteria bacterium]|nr:hypothetical protein [Candidatus Anaeroferrophillus wilburensis]MBN2890012.1 hypothetical protein [Deltaproteobacteria bacterium]
MSKLWIPLVELLGFFIGICGIAVWILHEMYTIATVAIGVGGVMIIIGMLAERFIVGYYED